MSLFRNGSNSAESSAQVQHQREAAISDRESVQYTNGLPIDGDSANEQRNKLNERDFCNAVQAELKRVQQTVMFRNPDKEVVMRFDFLSGRESRVQTNCTITLC